MFNTEVIEHLEHYDSGNVQAHYFTDYSGNITGNSIVYYDTDYLELFSVTQYEDGKIHGTAENYTAHGDVISNTDYKRGLKDGVCIDYYPYTKRVKSTRHYKNNHLFGEQRFYDNNGNLTQHYFINRDNSISQAYDLIDDINDIRTDEKITLALLFDDYLSILAK